MIDVSELKEWLDCMFDERTLPIQRKCVLGDLIRGNIDYTCGDCEYSCFRRSCITEGLDVLE